MMLRRAILNRLFGLLYTRLAWAYDAVAWVASAGYWYRWTASVLPFIESGPVLEVGSGRGRLLPRIVNLGHVAVGLDRSRQMAQYTAGQHHALALVGDGRAIPFADQRFGTLVTTFPAPYILEATTHEEFARVVRTGGLWLWVDAPVLNHEAITLPARLVERIARGKTATSTRQASLATLAQDLSGGLWDVQLRQLPVGRSTVTLRLARRR
jgi:ubiquinone/menaquinone biosynthesis C-methylase UbiE